MSFLNRPRKELALLNRRLLDELRRAEDNLKRERYAHETTLALMRGLDETIAALQGELDRERAWQRRAGLQAEPHVSLVCAGGCPGVVLRPAWNVGIAPSGYTGQQCSCGAQMVVLP